VIHKFPPRAIGQAIVSAAMLALAACGGGGGGPSGGTTPPPASTGPTWTQGVYQAASAFKDFCAVVRTGVDAEGKAFPDKAGTLLHEMFWLRSWTNQTYPWNTEVVDQNPASFSDRLAYFAVLKTTASTPSGKPKDQFHFSMLTSDYLAQVLSAPTASYGAELRIFASTVPRDVRVLYTQDGTPAAELLAGTPKLSRGARILTADGADVVNGGSQADVNTINAALFPRTAGESHTFLVQYPGGAQRTVTLTSAMVVEAPVTRTRVLSTPTGNVGYIQLNTFSPFSTEKAIVDAMTVIRTPGVTDVVLDLRYNGGGLLAIASQLSYQVAGASRTSGKIFERLQFNAAAGTTNPITGGANSPTPFYNTGLGFTVANGTTLQSLNLPRVFVLSTSSTCSASEAVINGLRGADVEVILIGTTTCGKPYGFYSQDNCGQTYFSIQFKGVNNKGFGDYADGYAAANASSAFPVKIPGCSVNDDLSHELGDPAEAMLAAALQYRATATCPTPAGGIAAAPALNTGEAPIEVSPRPEAADVLRNNRDMRLPVVSQ
jgi:hypothetical protein